MNRRTMSALIHGLFSPADGGDGNNGGSGNPPAFDPKAARETLASFGHDPEALKSLPDDKVKPLYEKVDGSLKKTRETWTNEFKTAEQKRQEQELADRKAKAPAKYDLKPSEDSLLDSMSVDRIAAIARERGLTNEEAQQQVVAMEQQAHEIREQNVAAWNKQIKEDKELGGEKLPTTQQNIGRFVAKFAPQGSDLAKLLHVSGYGSHPAVVRLMNQIGSTMKEDKPLNPGGGGGGNKDAAASTQEVADKMYPKTAGVSGT